MAMTRLQILGALVPIFAVAVILTRGGGGAGMEAEKGGKLRPWVQSQPVTWHFELQVEQWMDWTQFVDPALEPAETWVRNETGCSWDVDDAYVHSGFGDLVAGQQVSTSVCLVNDPLPIYACRGGHCGWWSGQGARHGLQVEADSPDLVVTACFEPQGRCFTLQPVQTNAKTLRYRYAACLDAVYLPNPIVDGDSDPVSAYPPPLVAIPGSAGSIRGGYGVLTTATLTAANPTSRIVRNASLVNSVDGLGRESVCAEGMVGEKSEGYPFKSWPTP